MLKKGRIQLVCNGYASVFCLIFWRKSL
jgi:hypothetical protein